MQPLSPGFFNQLPTDVLYQLADKLNAKNIGNLRATETVLWNDAALTKLQSDAQRKSVIDAVGAYIFRSADTIHDVVVELEAFLETLKQKFTNKNSAEIKEQSETSIAELKQDLKSYPSELNEKILGDQPVSQLFLKLPNIINIKMEIIKQEYLLSECKQYSRESLENSPLHQMYQDELSGGFHEQSIGRKFQKPNFFERRHAHENFAALFSSQPKEIQTYIQKRHQDDYQIRDNWIARNFPQNVDNSDQAIDAPQANANQAEKKDNCVVS